jgi:predicted amidohydrolase YtcJ
VRIDFVKVLADGNPEVGLASLLNHDGPPETATPGYYTPAQMTELVALAEQSRLSVFVHVIGDGAARQVLDAIAKARAASPCPNCRHTLTHMQWVAPADHPRLRALGVLANIQEGWLSPLAIGGAPGYDYAEDTARGPLGPVRARSMYPFRQLHQAGARLSASSDWFFTEENPWNTIEVGVTSRDPGVPDQKPMLPGSTLDRKTLIRARTLDAAYQMYNEAVVGSVEVGKEADLVVLDQNVVKVPVDRIHATKVLMTFFAGREVRLLAATATARPQ